MISEFVDKILQPLVADLPTYIKDTKDALKMFEEFRFPDQCDNRFLFTMDVASLYTNIPTKKGLAALKHFLPRSQFNINPSVVLRLAELVLNLNSFAFKDKHFLQVKGVAMGTRMGPSYACLFVGYVEEQIFQAYQGVTPDLYKRYIDDCVGVATCREQELLRFIDFVSNFNPNLKFTYEVSTESLPFLDVVISINPTSTKLSTTVHYKPTDAHHYLLYQSSHPKATKDAIPFSQFLRLKRICSDQTDFEEKAAEMEQFFLSRGYPKEITQPALQKASSTPRDNTLAPKTVPTKEDRPILTMDFHPHNMAVKNILLQNFGMLQEDPELRTVFSQRPLVAYKRDRNMRDLLVHARRSETDDTNHSRPGTSPCGTRNCKACQHIDTKTHFKGPKGEFSVRSNFNCQSSHVIYILTCTKCQLLYVGETYRPLVERFKEHERNARLAKKDTPVGQHFSATPHNLAQHMRIAAIYQTTRDGVFRKFMESSIIKKLGTAQPHGLNTRK